MRTYLDFEKPIAELESKIEELSALGDGDSAVSIKEEIARLREKAQPALEETYANLDPWQKTQVARHPERPHTCDYIRELIVDFTPLGGDRYFGEDLAIIGGLGQFHGRTVMILGHEKGADTQGAAAAQFRHGEARGLSQGRPADADGGPLRPAGRQPRRYRRRLSRHRGGGARTGRGHRPLHGLLPVAYRAHDRDHHRRGRLRRRGRGGLAQIACS